MDDHRKAPDPEGLAIAREIQKKLHSAEIILGGSRAVGEHSPDSDVDIMAICPDEDTVREADETLRQLLEGKQDVPGGERARHHTGRVFPPGPPGTVVPRPGPPATA